MTCEEFECWLQEQADGLTRVDGQADAFERHAAACQSCRELEEGFRLLTQGFASSRFNVPDFTSRVLADVGFQASETANIPSTLSSARAVPVATKNAWHMPQIVWAAAAAAIVAVSAIAFLTNRSEDLAQVPSQPLPDASQVAARESQSQPPQSEPLFPELVESNSPDARDDAPLLAAVEPMSQIVREFGRSLERPVRPIASITSQAVENWLKDLPDADPSMMPGMREMFPAPMMNKPPMKRS